MRIRRLSILPLVIFLASLLAAGCGSSSSTPVTPPVSDDGQSSSSSSSSAPTEPPVASIFPDYNSDPLPPDDAGMTATASDLAAGMGLGWNIGNTLEAIGGETAWGNPEVTPELIALVKEAGFNAIRIPVAWHQYADEATAEIDADWLNRVRDVVQMVVDEDLYAVVNIHWDGGWLENNIGAEVDDEINDRQRAYWEQIATHLRDFDAKVIFAGTNEPNVENADQMDTLMVYLQTFIDAVRATGGRNAYRTLVVQGPLTDIELTSELWTRMPEDSVPDRLMMEVHFYTPYNFALMPEDQSWGNRFFYWGEGNRSSTDTDHNPTWGEEAHIDDLMALMRHQFVDQGIPVLLGEYSAVRRTHLEGEALELHNASRAYYHRYVTEQAFANGLLPFYWDNGGLGNNAFGLFDRNNLTLHDEQVMDALLEALAASKGED
ncbi:glycoside hydrolase family 5 protein [Marinimicrobium alkaliphilum]|uniref:glycoside hydrolase family 5 protein n=1 Tax=Marinimicrobium alkaliphilum TaxID=2202654 RepID=UPI000DBA530A|nr:glycoside hydrolase family 5 protein [Marinimicrobium alkaliphilum]